MTQEELDAMMAGDIDLDSVEVESEDELYEIQDKVDGHEHKRYKDMELVTELTDVTAESEKKATEIFDSLDKVLAILDSIENKDEKIDQVKDAIFEIMSMLQYQDIHRQKIERVINTMVEISMVMNRTLHSVGKLGHIPSAKHIAGDKDTKDLADEDEIAKLVAEMGS